MNYLVQGNESAARLELLLKLTKIESEDIKAALHDHLVRGFKASHAAHINNVQQQNFVRAYKKLNSIAQIVEQIKELDWAHFKKQI
ncbi:hypothetical protein DS2_10287 [Catenovulum agarivorans DS-2]|uniref:Adhesin biosynthesis transcription regulatory protein n=1 Tax=Catenovulum agarivorans DS-2 TaxID=1328313 RepID=W7QD37_9ALTE|nr:PapB/FocB family fimbrial expression transcriptional regulator [Catenovulum agarivorans]EWH09831.1 hypothetical protein DS2_10287 [Catenovulum agarivorans DS-2]